MQLFINNWASRLASPLASAATAMQIPAGDAARLTGLGAGDHYLLTFVAVDGAGIETAHEIVKVTAAAGGVLTIERAQEGTAAADWPTSAPMEARYTAGAAAAPAASMVAHEQATDPHPQYLTQTEADGRYLQGATLAAVATSGSYNDLTEKPGIPSTAGEVGAIPASEKGAALGVATLDAASKIPLAQLPAAAITDSFVVNTEAAMLALSAQVGDVAIRPDVTSSFILQAEPASVLGNWQQIITPSIGGGAPAGSATPQALGPASPGVSGSASREDHVHPMPSAGDVGAAPSSHVGDTGTAHGVATGSVAGFMAAADKTKLDGIAAGATANSSDATLLSRGNHTGEQAISTVTGLQGALDGKAALLTHLNVTASRSFALTDIGKYLRSSSATAVSLTVEPSGTVAWPADAELALRVSGAGAVTLVAASGVTLNAPATGTLVLNQRMSVTIKRVGSTNEWDVIGQTVAA